MILGLLGSLLATPALAREDAAVPDVDLNADSLSVAVGAVYMPSYEGSDDYIVSPAGLIRGQVSGFNFFSRGTSFYVDAIPGRTSEGWDVELGPVANLRLDRSSRIKDPQVKALGRIGKAFELGGWAGIAKTGVLTSPYDNLSLRVAYLHDTGHVHGSYIVIPSLEYGTPLSPTAYAGISMNAQYVGSGYGMTYFGVTQAGATASGLSPYSTRGGGFKSMNASAFLLKSLTGNLLHGLAIGGGVSYTRLLGQYADSSIVSQAGSPDQWLGGAGLVYSF